MLLQPSLISSFQLLWHWYARKQGACDETISLRWAGWQFDSKQKTIKTFAFHAQVEEIDEILEMKVTHRKNLTRREKKFGWVAQFFAHLLRKIVQKAAFFGESIAQDCICVWDGEESCRSSSYSAGCLGRVSTGRSLCLGGLVKALLEDVKQLLLGSMYFASS